MNLDKLYDLKELLLPGSKIVVFGTGKAAKSLYFWLSVLDVKKDILCFLDNNMDACGKKFMNQFDIYAVNDFFNMDMKNVIILIASYFWEDIQLQLQEYDIKYKNAYPYCEDSIIWEEMLYLCKSKSVNLVYDNKLPEHKQRFLVDILKKNINLIDFGTLERVIYNLQQKMYFLISSKDYISQEQILIDSGYKANVDYFVLSDWIFGSELGRVEMWDKVSNYDKHKKGYYCPIPFHRWYIYSTGTNICCSWHINGLSQGSPADVEDLEDLWNSNIAQSIRESVLNGDFFYCNEIRCPWMYSNLLIRKEDIKTEYDRRIVEDGLTKIQGGPTYLNLGIDSMCNLHCRMCRDNNAFNEAETTEKLHDIMRKLKAYSFNNLETLFVAGNGEVFLNGIYKEILEDIDSFIMPKLKKIIIKTNGLLLDNGVALLEKLSSKYIIEVSVSIDASTEETYALIRRGGNFGILCKNLEELFELRKRNVVQMIEYSFCIQRRNVYEIEEFIVLSEKYGADKVRLQKVMGGALEDSIHEPGNVYYQTFIEQLNKAYYKAKEFNIDINIDAVKKLMVEDEI